MLDPKKDRQNKNPHLTGFLAGGLFLILGFGFFVSSARAQLATVATDVNTAATAFNTGILAGTEQSREIRGTLWSHLKLAGAMGIHTAVANFTQQLAMDFATDIAEAGSGKQPLLFGQPFGEYMTGLGLQAAADMIGELSSPLEEAVGFSLCEPSLNFRLGFILPVIKARFEPPKHRCEWKKLVSNWQEFGGSFSSDKELLEHISLGFTPGGNDIGVFLAVNDKLDLKLKQNIFSKMLDRQEGQGWKAVADVVTGNVKTPAQLVKTEVDANAVRPYSVSADTVSRAYMSTLSDPTFWIATAVSPFFNTLVSKSTQRLLQKGLISLIPEEEIELGALGGSGAGGGRTTAGGTAGYRQEISGLATPTTLATYDPISEMVSCPPEPTRQPNNCVMDNGLASALRLAQTGKALTLACALDPACARQEYLHGDWPLLPPEQERRPCVDGAYCYSNLVKLRQLRILPLGFEIAALNSGRQLMSRLELPRFASRDTAQMLRLATSHIIPVVNLVMGTVVPAISSDAIVDRPVTLKEVIDNFNNPSSLFYHLVDPNWIIKFPLTRCDAKVFGTSLVAQGSSSRAEVCVDTPSCISQDSRGNCLGWGHCLREKNVWKFPGESCPAQFASCLTLTDSRGKQASLLRDTLERCEVASAGCRWYSTNQDANGAWVDSSDISAVMNLSDKRVYLKNAANLQCSREQEGCGQFKAAAGADKYFKEAPNYYHCDAYTNELPDANARYALSNANRIQNCQTDGFLWRDDIQRCVGKRVGITKIKPSTECTRFARVCKSEEVGCLSYTPVTNAGPDVPGKIIRKDGNVWKDECPAECVGYSRYTAVKQFWDTANNTAYSADFIPANTRQCQAAEVGCTEFTSLAAGATGEQKVYFKSWRSCIVPGPFSATFYTWEGSDTQGFQLKAWSLKKHVSGAPELQGGGVTDSTCTGTTSFANNADCREFFDASGRKFYASAAKTITSSSDCQIFRKTAVDETSDGQVNANDCPGGAWGDGTCLIKLLPTEAQSCSTQAAGCREHRGTTAANVRTVSQDSFEDGTESGWTGNGASVAISNSSIHVGDYSLGAVSIRNSVNNSLGYVFLYKRLDALRPLAYFEVSFWARADSSFGIPSVSLSGQSTVSLLPVGSAPNLDANWRQYRFFGQQTAGTASGNANTLTVLVNGNFTNGLMVYFDDIILREVTQSVFAVQGSWQIPASCIAVSPTGRGDGVNMFGCGVYKQGNNTLNLRSFISLCRKEALGCQAYTKTSNYTASNTGVSFNQANDKCILGAVCSSNSSSSCPCYAPNKPQTPYFKLCDVVAGSRECNYAPGFSDNVTLPAHSTVYQVVNQATSCTAAFKGCQALGEPLSLSATTTAMGGNGSVTRMGLSTASCDLGRTCTVAGGCVCEAADGAKNSDGSSLKCTVAQNQERCTLPFKTVYIKNNPDLYQSDGRLCTVSEDRCEAYTYRDSQNRTVQMAGKKPFNWLCEWRDGVLVNGVSQSGWFIKGTDVQCPASSSLEHAATVTESSYRGFVAACGPEHNLCTQFVDPRSPASPYFVISSNQLDRSSCQGQVSEKFGCIPFTDYSNQDLQGNVTLSINSALSFKDSTANQYEPVRAVDCSLTNGQPRDQRCLGNFCIMDWGGGQTCELFDSNSAPQICETAGGCSCQLISDTQVSCTVRNGETSCVKPAVRQVGPSCNIINSCPSLTVNGSSVPLYTGCQILANDANTVIKVDRDRQCGQWLACRSSSTVFDPRTNQQRQICQQFDLCSQLAPDGSCADGKFVSQLKSGGGLNPDRVSFLDREVYQNRGATTARSGIAWSDQDFSGYSTYLFDRRSNKQGAYQPYDLEQVNIGTAENPDIRLVYVSPLAADYAACQAGSARAGVIECGTANLVGAKGTCYSGRCVWAADGRKVEAQNETAFPKSCRGYPEAEAPFKSELKGSDGRLPNGFDNVKVCDETDGVCDCNYQKATYKGGTTRYYGPMSENVPGGICQGGKNDGKPCDGTEDKIKCAANPVTPDPSDPDNGRCMAKEKVQPFLGWQGYCLQKDRQTRINGNEREFACASWLPLDQAQGSQDLYNQYADAGFNPQDQDLYYCSVKQANDDVYLPGNFRDLILINHEGGTPPTADPRDSDYVVPEGLFYGRNGLDQGWGQSSGVFVFDISKDNLKPDGSYSGSSFPRLDRSNLERIEIKLGDGEAEDWSGIAQTTITLSADNNWQFVWCGGSETDALFLCNNLSSGANAPLVQNGSSWRSNPDYTDRYLDQGDPVRRLIATSEKDVCGEFKSGGKHDESNLLAVAARFNSQTGALEGFSSGLCDGSAKRGYVVTEKTTFVLRDVCQVYEQVLWPSGENSAFTDRLALESSYQFGSVDYSKDKQPYGAIMVNSLPTTSPATSWGSAHACYQYVNGSCSSPDWGTLNGARSVGVSNLMDRLFRRIYRGRIWGNDEYQDENNNTVRDSTNASVISEKPRVAQVKRRESDRLGKLDAVTVADRVGGRVSGVKSFDTSISFYAWADRNHLPLRKIEVDFGDGSPNAGEGVVGKYKNTKPYCSTTNDGRADVNSGTAKVCFPPPITPATQPNLNITCKDDEDCEGVLGEGAICGVPGISDDDTPRGMASVPWNSKGNRPEACDPHFREYFHTYTCDFGTWNGLPGCPTLPNPGNLSRSSSIQSNGCKETGTDGKSYCVFKPRVQVKDNWGWCNGGYGGFTNGAPNASCGSSDIWAEFSGEVRVAAN